MKGETFLTIFLSVVAFSAGSFRSDEEVEAFKDWAQQFQKVYRSESEELKAMEKFWKSKDFVDTHNELFAQGKKTYRMRLNEHSDLTLDEVKRHLTGYRETEEERLSRSKRESTGARHAHFPPGPQSIDWRKRGLVGPVENQRSCGACWAFSTAGLMYALMHKDGRDEKASVQQLLDCCHNEASGCHGGNPYHALEYIKDNGIAAQDEFPYANKVKTCRYKESQEIATINEAHRVFTSGNETLLKDIVAHVGPISNVLCVEDSFRHYHDGVYNEPTCCKSPDHAPMIVGYGTDSFGGDYWILKNSWGTNWGIDGYAKVARNKGNMCNIAHIATWAS